MTVEYLSTGLLVNDHYLDGHYIVEWIANSADLPYVQKIDTVLSHATERANGERYQGIHGIIEAADACANLGAA